MSPRAIKSQAPDAPYAVTIGALLHLGSEVDVDVTNQPPDVVVRRTYRCNLGKRGVQGDALIVKGCIRYKRRRIGVGRRNTRGEEEQSRSPNAHDLLRARPKASL